MELRDTNNFKDGNELTKSPLHVSVDRVDLTKQSDHSTGNPIGNLCGALENVETPTTKAVWTAYDQYTAEKVECK